MTPWKSGTCGTVASAVVAAHRPALSTHHRSIPCPDVLWLPRVELTRTDASRTGERTYSTCIGSFHPLLFSSILHLFLCLPLSSFVSSHRTMFFSDDLLTSKKGS
jgi:hypothetical protein